ncbi:MAG: hypothetical protein ICV68_16545, partial [Pyrinomonadaceae bacterium]|nr:hypothetical protein [Pyrinomonadaceae bacterium]
MQRTITNKAPERNRLLPILSGLLLVLTGLFTGTALAQTTYNWTGAVDTDWNKPLNWQSTVTLAPRITPANNDILVLGSGTPVTVSNVSTETVGQLVVTGNTAVTLQANTAGTQTLTIAGGAGTGLVVAAGSSLNINGTSVLNILLGANAAGSVSGSMTFTNAMHTITGPSANSLVFNAGATFTQGLGCIGSVFDSGGTDGVVVFSGGSTFISRDGATPFGTATKVIFQTGSLYSHQQEALPSLSGRTYANFEMNYATYNRTAPSPGNSPWTVDNLTITATGSPTGFGVNHAGAINIRGNLSVNGGILSFVPAAANTLTFNGTGTQLISGAGILNISSFTTATVGSGSTVVLGRPLTLNGNLQINGVLESSTQNLTVTGSTTIQGTFLDTGAGGTDSFVGPLLLTPTGRFVTN